MTVNTDSSAVTRCRILGSPPDPLYTSLARQSTIGSTHDTSNPVRRSMRCFSVPPSATVFVTKTIQHRAPAPTSRLTGDRSFAWTAISRPGRSRRVPPPFGRRRITLRPFAALPCPWPASRPDDPGRTRSRGPVPQRSRAAPGTPVPGFAITMPRSTGSWPPSSGPSIWPSSRSACRRRLSSRRWWRRPPRRLRQAG
jgi:hypothetical protein